MLFIYVLTYFAYKKLTKNYLPSSGMRLLFSATRPPSPHRVSASNDINVTDDIKSRSLASSLEPAIRTILKTLMRESRLRYEFLYLNYNIIV